MLVGHSGSVWRYRPLGTPVPRSESHLLELDDGSRWQIFPGDLDLTLNWKPETEITVAPEDDVASHLLIGGGAKVRVIPEGESWPGREIKNALKDG